MASAWPGLTSALVRSWCRVTITGASFAPLGTWPNGEVGAEPAEFVFEPVDTSDNTHYATEPATSFKGPLYSDPSSSKTVIIAGTIGNSSIIDSLIEQGKLNTTAINGKWEAFVSQVVKDPIKGCDEAVVIVGSMPRGTIYGIYDISEQIGVSPWHFWADVPAQKHSDIWARRGPKVQGPPSVKYRGFFLNDEQPGLTNWVSDNFPDLPNGSAGYGHVFYSLVCEVLLRLRANYLWPTLWASMLYTDDAHNQPLVYAYEVVLGSSHTEPLMRAQNEFKNYYEGEWAYNENNETIDEYFRYGVQRAKPYARNSVWTMGMRGSGDTAIEGLGVEYIVEMLETLVQNQRDIISEGLGVDAITDVPQTWCLYKEVQGYLEQGLRVPEDITLLWSDDNWGNIRRLPLANETDRPGGAGVYYHFDYVGGPRDYKWINTVQLSKTAEQMHMAYARRADRIWVVNVGDLKPLEVPISHFLDLAYDAERWDVDSTAEWTRAWAEREFGVGQQQQQQNVAGDVASVMARYGKYAARRKYELLDAETYSVVNYDEADVVAAQWAELEADARAAHDALGEEYRPAFFQMVLHPVTAGRIVHEMYVAAAKNGLYAAQRRNAANEQADLARALLDDDADLTVEWDEMLDGKWARMLDQTHLGYTYWQQPMRNALPPLTYVQTRLTSLAGNVRVGVEGSYAGVPGDDAYHANSGNTLVAPPMDRYGPGKNMRWFDVFLAGAAEECEWTAEANVSWARLSQTRGVVGTAGHNDTRVTVEIDWDAAGEGEGEGEGREGGELETAVEIAVDSPCRKWDKSRYAYGGARVQIPVRLRSVPGDFARGFVESDGYIAIEAPHYQAVTNGSSGGSGEGNGKKDVSLHVFEDYGRALGGVGAWPPATEKMGLEEAPSAEYDVYVFTGGVTANVTLYLSPGQNYLGDATPLEYAVSLYPVSTEGDGTDAIADVTPPLSSYVRRQFVGPASEGEAGMPPGWDDAVADAAWGAAGKGTTGRTTTGHRVEGAGRHRLSVKLLMPGVVVQRVVVDLGGVRESYLGPPESLFVGEM
ncbi:hypothetical protein N3K66_005320 [Trichothecium roseum]|uniref:Uncharacterized protein n=1 Tax=Trichothecium roseum TaxID=47278 RepID=A0ACC0UXL0_9HYPO|nr:hypothetical protein N3K66_005320 [Trichothecium roseum]